MSAQVLREAAALMRERAEAANADAPAPWSVDPLTTFSASDHEVRDSGGTCIAYSETGHNASLDGTVAEHVASWHPAVALLVADWLDTQASRWTQVYADVQTPSAGVDQPPARHFGDPDGAAQTATYHTRQALAVAKAYLATPPH